MDDCEKDVKCEKVHLPLYAKGTTILLGLFTLIATLYLAKNVIIPLVFGIIVAILLHPVVNFFVDRKINRIIAILIALLFTFIFIAAFALLMASQISRFSESWPQLVERFTEILHDSTIWASDYFNISTKKVTIWITEKKIGLIERSGAMIGSTIISVGTTVALVLILPVYIFLILYYQPILIEFIHRLFGDNNRKEVGSIVNQIKTLVQRYLVGLSIEVVIVATLFTLGLFALGIEYAVILGIIGALLNLIPYLGAIMGAVLPMILALIYKPSPWYALLVMGLFIVVQFIDNNYIVPKIVASQVKINVLVSITAVFTFGLLWGIPGMFLAIPLTGILKLIFDQIDPLKPWGFLLGDTMPKDSIIKIKPLIDKIIAPKK
jgi:predicted PurR-regulated permease PerM